MKQLIAFDMDGTLALSKQAIDGEMAALLGRLTHVTTMAVISGGDWPQFEKQLVGRLPDGVDATRLLVMPTTGTKLYRFADGHWAPVYAELFDDAERRRIREALDGALADTGLAAAKTYGPQIEDRGSQITFSALGQQAPLEVKDHWDSDAAKRQKLKAALAPLLPGFAINIGGATSIDITRAGVDKGYAMRRLSEETGIAATAMLFLGDAIFPGGNDYAVKAAGIDTVKVRDPEETKRVIDALLAWLGG